MEIGKNGSVVLVPLMTKERFAELSGIPEGILAKQIERDYLPSLRVGKHRYVNVAKLYQACVEEDLDG